MERFGFGAACVIMILGGIWMSIRPRQAALLSKERDEPGLPTTGEIWQMRVVGGVFFVAGCSFLYAILTKAPGADFLTP